MKTWFCAFRPLFLASFAALLTGPLGCNLIFGIESGTATTTGTTTAETTASSSSSSESTTQSEGGGGSSTTSSGGGEGGGTSTTSNGGEGGVSLSGCVLLLHFDEASWSGQDSIKDSSGAANDGTPTGLVVPTPDGKFGGAALFDGSGAIVVPDAPSLHPTTELTLSAWVYPTALGDGSPNQPAPGIFSKRLAFEQQVAYTLFFGEENKAYADIEAVRFSTSLVFENDTWWHIAVVYNGMLNTAVRSSIYVNGVLDSVDTGPETLAPNIQDLRIGDLPGGGDPFIGKVDEVAVWSRALTEHEVKLLAEGATPQ